MNYQQITRVLGTTTNDNAAAGYVGEVVDFQLALADRTALTTATWKELANGSLTAGHWEISAFVGFVTGTGTTITLYAGALSLVTAALDSQARAIVWTENAINHGDAAEMRLAISPTSLKLASTTTLYLNAIAVFGTSTLTSFGYAHCVRVR